eukprot:UN12723
MFVKPIKNFLEAFEKSLTPFQKNGFVRIFQPEFWADFLKISTFSLFLAYKSDWCVVRSRFVY